MARILLTMALAYFSFNAHPQTDTPDPAAIMREIDVLAGRQLWPGFNPTKYPVAFYTGDETLLFRYPGTPDGFTDRNGTLVYPGRHEVMTANSSASLNDVTIATVLLDSKSNSSTSEIAGLTIHELFHVFQRTHHPDWSANEALLFTYPYENQDILYLRKLGNEAMRRALKAESLEETEKWTFTFLQLRKERFDQLSEAHSTYERKSELNEGLARYVQDLATGSNLIESIPKDGWPLTHIRQRTYVTGNFLAHMLDRFAPGWKDQLENETVPLDELLSSTFEQREISSAEFSDAEKDETRKLSKSIVDELDAEKLRAREDFLSQDGWKIIIDATGSNLLALKGFDPVNVFNIGNGEILHYRMLKLGNDLGNLDILDHTSLSYGPNEHPLFHGVRTVTIAGLAEKPTITEANGNLEIKSEGIDISFEGATYSESDDQEITVRLKQIVNDTQSL